MKHKLMSRREATGSILRTLGGAVLFACGTSTNGSSGQQSSADDSGGDSGGSTTPTTEGGASTWASGGTQAMTGNYPDPFTTPAATCVLAVAATQGPCTEADDRERTDISEGYTGLPMRLALRVVDASCKPIAGAKVKVWHTQINGSYSGNTPNNGMCLKDAADASQHYFRGVQTTGENGRVDFDSCFPGWYRGRTVHVHFTVTVGGESFTSQLVWDQALVSEIFTTHPEYVSYGLPDTTNATDDIVGRGDLSTYTVAVERMSDGAMLASKELVVDLG